MAKDPKSKPWLARVAEGLSKAKINRAKAAAIKYEGKAAYIKAKQGTAKLNAIARGAVGVAAAMSAGSKSSNASNALAEWAKTINSQANPADGTGPASMGGTKETVTTGDSESTGTPLGNYNVRG